MQLVLFGPPGSGKGTMVQMLQKDYKFHYVYPGGMILTSYKPKATPREVYTS